jgi:hypothetical protein
MRRTIGKDRQNEFDLFAIQRTEIDIHGIELTFIYFAPLTECAYLAISNLILKAENHITVVGLVLTANQCLEAVARLNPNGLIFAADYTISVILRMGEQAFALRFAILHLGRVKYAYEAIIIAVRTRAGQVA